MRHNAHIAGVGMTPFGVHENDTVGGLTARAVNDALHDAGIAVADIDSVFFANATQGALEGQLMVPGQIALRRMGFERVPVFNVENACASGSSALSLAITSVRAGESEIALAVGVEKMNVGDRMRSMTVFDGAYDVSDPAALDRILRDLGGDVDLSAVGPRSRFMDIYAAMARSHMAAYGSTQRQLAAVAAKNHRHSVANPLAHFRRDMSIEDVLAGRPLGFPLTVPMCSPLTDGAAAVIVCSEPVARRLAGDRSIEVLACAVGTGTTRAPDDFSRHITRLAGQRAFESAGVGPAEIDVAEVHDATAFGELLVSELLGLVAMGEGGPAAEAGVTSLGGRIPINTSGGLESKGHPLAATGFGQVFELVAQLRGEAGARQVEGARIALAENGGGFVTGEEAVAVVTILQNRRR